jgi:uncharacterized protein YacL
MQNTIQKEDWYKKHPRLLRSMAWFGLLVALYITFNLLTFFITSFNSALLGYTLEIFVVVVLYYMSIKFLARGKTK